MNEKNLGFCLDTTILGVAQTYIRFEPLGPPLDDEYTAKWVAPFKGGRFEVTYITRYFYNARFLTPSGKPLAEVEGLSDSSELVPEPAAKAVWAKVVEEIERFQFLQQLCAKD